MSDVGSKGHQAYTWIVRGVAGVLGAAGLLYLNNINTNITKTAEALQTIQIDIGIIKAQARHSDAENARQNTAIDELQRRVWRMPDRALQ